MGYLNCIVYFTYFYMVDLALVVQHGMLCVKTTPIYVYNFAYLLWKIIIILNNDLIIVFISVVMK